MCTFAVDDLFCCTVASPLRRFHSFIHRSLAPNNCDLYLETRQFYPFVNILLFKFGLRFGNLLCPIFKWRWSFPFDYARLRLEYNPTGMSPGCSLCLHLVNSFVYSKSFVVLRSCAMFAFLFPIFFSVLLCSEQILLVCFGLGAASAPSSHTRTIWRVRNRERLKCIDGTSWPRHSGAQRSKHYLIFILAHSKIHISRLDASLDLCLWLCELNSCQPVHYIRSNGLGVRACVCARNCATASTYSIRIHLNLRLWHNSNTIVI